ncbi:MAG: methyltransferase domain-containing protein [Alphaproteobacteria bacterium]|jgi:SAM-dependent methyltransferase
MTDPPKIFDRSLYACRRLRSRGTDFLVGEAAARIAERLMTVNRRFSDALDISSRNGALATLRPLVDRWIITQLSGSGADMVADEEALPFANASFDLIVSVLSLHAINDLPGALIQIRRALRPDGLFMAALFGGETLQELRAALAAGETQIRGGASLRVAPFSDVRDLGALLQRAGFALPVADVERTTVHYRDFTALLTDLRALGETNALCHRSCKFLRRDVLSAALTEYADAHTESGRLRATFDIIYLTGWAPHENQQKPLAPGSARAHLADALGNRVFPTSR